MEAEDFLAGENLINKRQTSPEAFERVFLLRWRQLFKMPGQSILLKNREVGVDAAFGGRRC
jgi:hypothetical protein